MRIIIEIDPDGKAESKKLVSGESDTNNSLTSASAINAGLANIPPPLPLIEQPILINDSMASISTSGDTKGINAGGFSNSGGNDSSTSSSASPEMAARTASTSGMNAGVAKPTEGNGNPDASAQPEGELSSIDKANAIDAGGFRGEATFI